jgi:hypothetical protein
MTGQEQIAIVKHVPYSILKKRIKHHKGLPEVMPRLLFIRLRYKGGECRQGRGCCRRIGADGLQLAGALECRRVCRAGSAVCRWTPVKLADEQKAELLEKLRDKDHWTTVEAQRLIQSHFGVAYSLDQVRRILKSFGMHYGNLTRGTTAGPGMQRGFSKKLPRMSKHTVLGFLDECSPQTTANTQRMWSFDHLPLVKNTKKIRANTFAVLAVNGTSIVTFRSAPNRRYSEVLREYRRANPDTNGLSSSSTTSARIMPSWSAYCRRQQHPSRTSSAILAGSQSHRAGLAGDQRGSRGRSSRAMNT